MKIILIVLTLVLSLYANAWVVRKETDKMTDAKIVQIIQSSRNAVWSKKSANLAVIINCKTDHWALGVIHPLLIGKGPAKLRIDKEDPFPIYASPSADRKVLLVGDQSSTGEENPKTLIERIKDANNFVIQYEDITGKMHQADFSMKGLGGKLKAACK